MYLASMAEHTNTKNALRAMLGAMQSVKPCKALDDAGLVTLTTVATVRDCTRMSGRDGLAFAHKLGGAPASPPVDSSADASRGLFALHG